MTWSTKHNIWNGHERDLRNKVYKSKYTKFSCVFRKMIDHVTSLREKITKIVTTKSIINFVENGLHKIYR